MPYQMLGQLKLCATCNFWVGPRQPDYYGRAVVLESQIVKGKCWCLNGPYARVDKYSNNTTCPRYEKWAMLTCKW